MVNRYDSVMGYAIALYEGHRKPKINFKNEKLFELKARIKEILACGIKG